jgi:uncharacterized membrane protein YoaK (UPF0700 family)
MFRHKGKTRTFRHNFRLAAFLCFTAGLVNICGVLALGVLTTNVTGHFAYFAEGVFKKDALPGFFFLFYILAFLSGSFVSNLLTEYFAGKDHKAPHNAAMFSEILLLLIMGLFGDIFISWGVSKPLLACMLLFAMGLQNSLVSKISNSIVRTTHLTGLFTDLGIELSQLFFYKGESQRKQLLHSISLRCGIIAFFFAGCVVGGFLYMSLKFRILIIAAIILIIALVYDDLRLGYYRIRKRLNGDGVHE